MSDEPASPQFSALRIGQELLRTIPNGTTYSYNLDEKKTPGGLKVRWKIRVATGPEAARWDARHADAIKELLTWATQHRRQHPR